MVSRPAGQRIVLITGASRGIGAETARILAARGDHVIVNYREKMRRAKLIADEIVAAGGSASVAGADIADADSARGLIESIVQEFGRLDVLVLNASGGLERNAAPGYAMEINRDAQTRLVDLALPHMPSGSRIVFVTSHQAHFHGRKPVPADYEPIAASKRAGEDALRAMIPTLTARGVTLHTVSGDMIDGTIIVQLLERRNPDAVAARRDTSPLPTIAEFATAVAEATTVPAESGHTTYIGGPDYLTPA
ncbi:NAD(P)-dependent dehydrogenase (short-subunit alcohol dehydrogenase family) [Nocardia tenerifensis]|uniref:NAD(P)-dependent dehydrogenase (Short-subunit alcohol dehydrogenase family) n=1 Tax=Nocardia tenerifensis TaxID=228006 RepID=A0A318JYZ8_9NOCA|nr:SDR family oxidoreductase [Nocardia tenerifensis]PXX63962.1 NAD(P)-dependent dehydrogenase (short-subunit alcohol dehydrogenase family) [Nocardia tenerifensis]